MLRAEAESGQWRGSRGADQRDGLTFVATVEAKIRVESEDGCVGREFGHADKARSAKDIGTLA